MALTQAIVLGGIYWVRNVRISYIGPGSLFTEPITVALWVGMVFGDIPNAMRIAATIQPMYLAFLNAGGAVPSDSVAATIVTIAVLETSGMSYDQGVALAVSVGVLTAQLHTIRRIVAAAWVNLADKYAEECNIRGIVLCGTVYTHLPKIIIFWIPMTLFLYFGGEFIGQAMTALPIPIKTGLSAVSKMMPALGYGMTVMVIGRKDLLPYFIGGFFFAKYSGLATMPIAMVALFLAYLNMRFHAEGRDGEGAGQILASLKKTRGDEPQRKRLLDKGDITKTFIRWIIVIEQSNSFERLQALAYCVSIAPVLKKLYGEDKAELSEALKRHLVFFNVSGIWGGLIHGIVLSMEEQRALGVDIPASAITSVKTGLMGPLSGIGDTIDWSTIKMLIMVMALPYAAQGYWWAALFMPVLLGTWCMIEGLFFIHLGYRLGTNAAMTLLQSGALQKVLSFFGVLGMFMIGGLSANMVNVQLGIVISTSGEPMRLQQDVLDKILPGLLSILTVMGVYRYLAKGGTMLKCTLWLLLFGTVGGVLGILA